ncbi:MAG: N-methyl-D-aspartate receptor NMDAR2C subunit [Proteobacteria bacterium]|nr:N-methyl-D-aspartate receptor NMDAR2C subunit [Pseudomonadota bacterium]
MTNLRAFWDRCFEDLEVSQPPPCAFDELRARYSEPHRAYHTLQHLDECFALFETARPLMKEPGVVAVTLFYHDAIYDTHRSDNEEKSADLAEAMLDEYCALSHETSAQIRDAILATKHNVRPTPGDCEAVVDIDLSILGALPARFDEYETQVRREYAWVSDDDFRTGRTKILREFVARQPLYRADLFKVQFEARARDNLMRSLRALEAR